jgi:hypothetical protein
VIHDLKTIVICHIGNDWVVSGGLNGLEMHPKLIEDLTIPNMESTEKKYHQEDGLYYHLTMGQFKSKAVKAGAILNDGLRSHWTSLKREREEKWMRWRLCQGDNAEWECQAFQSRIHEIDYPCFQRESGDSLPWWRGAAVPPMHDWPQDFQHRWSKINRHGLWKIQASTNKSVFVPTNQEKPLHVSLDWAWAALTPTEATRGATKGAIRMGDAGITTGIIAGAVGTTAGATAGITAGTTAGIIIGAAGTTRGKGRAAGGRGIAGGILPETIVMPPGFPPGARETPSNMEGRPNCWGWLYPETVESNIKMLEANGGGMVVCSKDPSGATVSPSEDASDATACGPRSGASWTPLYGKT